MIIDIFLYITGVPLIVRSRGYNSQDAILPSLLLQAAVQDRVRIGLPPTQAEQIMGAPISISTDRAGKVVYEYSTQLVSFRDNKAVIISYLGKAAQNREKL